MTTLCAGNQAYSSCLVSFIDVNPDFVRPALDLATLISPHFPQATKPT